MAIGVVVVIATSEIVIDSALVTTVGGESESVSSTVNELTPVPDGVPEMAPVRRALLDGARFIYGHTVMQRALGLGYGSGWAQAHLPTRRERNAFYQAVGYKVPPGRAGMATLRKLDPTLSPAKMLELL